jgi:hypothetical protein
MILCHVFGQCTLCRWTGPHGPGRPPIAEHDVVDFPPTAFKFATCPGACVHIGLRPPESLQPNFLLH